VEDLRKMPGRSHPVQLEPAVVFKVSPINSTPSIQKGILMLCMREFSTFAEDGKEVLLCECLVETDSTTMRGADEHSAHYFRTKDGQMRALRATLIEPGVYKLEDGRLLREPSN
jgi:hypothetical protein